MRFGEYIKKLREAKSLSLVQAARELGLTPQKLCDLEQGRRNFRRTPPVKLLQNMAAVYDHPYSSLVANTEFFQYEKTLIDELLSRVEPLCAGLERSALDMVLEARQYTPELEGAARQLHGLVGELKLALQLSRAQYSRASKAKADETRLPLASGTEG